MLEMLRMEKTVKEKAESPAWRWEMLRRDRKSSTPTTTTGQPGESGSGDGNYTEWGSAFPERPGANRGRHVDPTSIHCLLPHTNHSRIGTPPPS